MGDLDFAKFVSQSTTVVRALIFVLGSFLVFRLYSSKLYGNFPRFTAMIALDVVLSAEFALAEKVNPKHIMRWYLANLILRTLLYVAVTFELYEKILKTHKGLASLGRKAVGTFTGIAIAGALIWLFTQGNQTNLDSGAFAVNVLRSRIFIMVTLMVFVSLVFGILLWFPIKLTANSKAFGVGFTLYFASKFVTSAVIFARGSKWVDVMNLAMFICEAGCYAYWILRLSREGEIKPSTPLRKLSPGDQEVLLRQLDRAERQIMRTFGQ